MINQIQAGHLRASTLSHLNSDALGMPETGEFDFLNYLLGLQVGATDPQATDEMGLIANQPNLSEEVDGSDKALIDLFDKHEEVKNAGLQLQASQFLMKSETPIVTDFSGLKGLEKNGENIQELKQTKELRSVFQTDLNKVEDPLAKVAFEMAIAKKGDPNSQELVSSNQNSQIISRQQREKLLQAFQAMPREMKAVSSPDVVEGPIEIKKASGALTSMERLERPRKKESDNVEWMVSDGKSEVSLEGSPAQTKGEIAPKISHVPVPDVFQKVESLAYQGGGKMTVMLTPPELGQVEIHVSTKGKNVEVSVKSDNDFAKTAIESQVADLQQSLQNQDLNLTKIEVQVSREMDPAFLENQFAGFSRSGNFYQQSEGSQQNSQSEQSWKSDRFVNNRLSTTARGSEGALPIRTAYRSESRVDIRI